MKQLNILILEASDGGHLMSDLSRKWNMGTLEPLMHADLAIRIENGQVEVVKNRYDTNKMSGLIEDIAFAYSEGKI